MALWNKIWSLSIPSKATHLLWRICDDLLPQYKSIRRKVTAADETCFSFDGRDVDVTHTLLRCEYARVVWFACPLTLHVDDIHFDSLSEFVSFLCDVWDDDTIALWAMLAWGIWFNRHTRCQGKKGLHPTDLIKNVLKELYDFQNPNLNVDKQVQGRVSWIAPPRGWVKISCHVFYFSSQCMNIGCVIRDDMGGVLGSFVENLSLDTGFLNKGAQEMAVYHSLLFGLDMGFRLIILESDYQPVVEKLQSMEWETSEAAGIIVRCKNLQPEDYQFIVDYISRDQNQLAESIAGYATEVDDFMAWVDDLPPMVSDLVQLP